VLDSLSAGIFSTKENWILDADIRSFFDEVRQEWLLRFLEHRINDASRSKFTDLEIGSALVLTGRRLGDEITLTSGFAKHSKRRPSAA
jgi:hypothetical protein